MPDVGATSPYTPIPPPPDPEQAMLNQSQSAGNIPPPPDPEAAMILQNHRDLPQKPSLWDAIKVGAARFGDNFGSFINKTNQHNWEAEAAQGQLYGNPAPGPAPQFEFFSPKEVEDREGVRKDIMENASIGKRVTAFGVETAPAVAGSMLVSAPASDPWAVKALTSSIVNAITTYIDSPNGERGPSAAFAAGTTPAMMWLGSLTGKLWKGGANVVRGWLGKSGTPEVSGLVTNTATSLENKTGNAAKVVGEDLEHGLGMEGKEDIEEGGIAKGVGKPVENTPASNPNPDMDNLKYHQYTNGDTIKEILNQEYAKDKNLVSGAFNAVRAKIGDEVNPSRYIQSIDETLKSIDKLKIRGEIKDSFTTLIKSFRKVVVNDQGKAPNLTWDETLDVGRDINGALSDAKAAHNAELERWLMGLKNGFNAMLDDNGSPAGQAYRDAKALYIAKRVPWEDADEGARFLQRFMSKPNPNDGMRAFTLMGPDVAKKFIAQGGPQIRGALQAGYAQSILEAGSNNPLKKLDPMQVLTAMNQREALFNHVFDGAPTEKAKWEGFRMLMEDAYKVRQIIPGKYGVAPGEVAAKLFTTPGGSNFLLGMSKLHPESEASRQFFDVAFPRVMGVSAGKFAGSMGGSNPKQPQP